MSGHSKWANIKHRKAAQDAKRGKVFARVIKEIALAVKAGGSDPEANPRLRTALANAKGVNMPKDNIDRAVKKAAGADASSYEEITFEGYAPNGIAIFVEAMTDNKNRTLANIRAIFNKGGGRLGKNGAHAFVFERKGVFVLESGKLALSLEDLELELIDGGASEIETHRDSIWVYTAFEDFGTLQNKLDQLKLIPQSASLQRIPNVTQTLAVDAAKSVISLVDKLEADGDVQAVFHNLELTEALCETLMG